MEALTIIIVSIIFISDRPELWLNWIAAISHQITFFFEVLVNISMALITMPAQIPIVWKNFEPETLLELDQNVQNVYLQVFSIKDDLDPALKSMKMPKM